MGRGAGGLMERRCIVDVMQSLFVALEALGSVRVALLRTNDVLQAVTAREVVGTL